MRKGRLPPSPYDTAGGTNNRSVNTSASDFFAGTGSGFAPGGQDAPGGFAPKSRPAYRPPERRRGRAAPAVITVAALLVMALAAAWLFLPTANDAPAAPSLDTPGPAPDKADTGGAQTGAGPGTADNYAAPPLQDEGASDSGGEIPVRELAAELIPHFETRYFINNLPDESLKLVCELYSAAMDFETEVKITALVNSDELSVCAAAMMADCPEIMQLDFSKEGYRYNYERYTGRVDSIELSYVMTREEYLQSREACLDALAQIVSLADGLDGPGMERAAFDYIIGPTRYDSESEMCGTAYGALVERRAKCIGFSNAMKWAMDELGIPALTISAQIPGQVEGHAWNIVELDGQWYRVDLTPSAIYEDEPDIGFDRPIYYALNISDSIDTTSYIIDPELRQAAPVPVCDSMALSPYALDGRLVKSGEDGNAYLHPALDTALTTGDGRIILQFEDKNDYTGFMDNLDDTIQAWAAEQDLGYSYYVIHTDQFNLMALSITFT